MRFESLPVLDWHNPNLKFIDLTGDGFPDLLISEDDAFCWHSLAGDRGLRAGAARARRPSTRRKDRSWSSPTAPNRSSWPTCPATA